MLLIQTEVLVKGQQTVSGVQCRRYFNIHIYCLNYKKENLFNSYCPPTNVIFFKCFADRASQYNLSN